MTTPNKPTDYFPTLKRPVSASTLARLEDVGSEVCHACGESAPLWDTTMDSGDATRYECAECIAACLMHGGQYDVINDDGTLDETETDSELSWQLADRTGLYMLDCEAIVADARAIVAACRAIGQGPASDALAAIYKGDALHTQAVTLKAAADLAREALASAGLSPIATSKGGTLVPTNGGAL